MKLFSCPRCGARLYFENSRCLACGTAVACLPREARFAPLDETAGCANREAAACNWAAEAGGLCAACRLNRTIPDLAVPGNAARWARVEAAKRRAVYALIAFGLDVAGKAHPDAEIGLAFDLLADPPQGGRVLTGHHAGLITLNVAEADSAERERMRTAMGEPYRTLLGHFRHELGHYYWERLVRDDSARLARFRALFGDERADYAAALRRHYEAGPPADWQERHISAYAASHPWEDWAESWAHYLHIADTLEMAEALGLPFAHLDTVVEAEGSGGFEAALSRWLALGETVNALNRCMGLADLYPFVISPAAAGKLRFVHALLAGRAAGARPEADREA